MTSTYPYSHDLLRRTLEEQYELHTSQLAELSAANHHGGDSGYDQDTRIALITSSRRALSDIAHALRRMAQGTYGLCERCGSAIGPTARSAAARPVLRALPGRTTLMHPGSPTGPDGLRASGWRGGPVVTVSWRR